ncbi:MAG: LON peptidase substrate-binding domain-containing protein [Pseudomonadota bacterium]
MSIDQPTQKIPIFPLNTVLFPGGPLSLRIFEPRYLDMVRDCAAQDGEFGVNLIVDGKEAGETPSTVVMGTTARIQDFYTMDDGLLGITAVGVQRYRILKTAVRDNGLLTAEVALVAPAPAQSLKTEHLLLRTLLERLLDSVSEHYNPQPVLIEDADWVGSRLSELLPLDGTTRQMLLELDDPGRRLDRLLEIVPQLQSDQGSD